MKQTFFAILMMLVPAGFAHADEPQLIKTYRDWDAFTQGTGANKICFMASVPKKKSPGSVKHGSVHITLAHKPRRKIEDEVNIVVGYTFKPGSNVRVEVGGRRENLFTSGAEAWAEHPDVDERLVKSMMKGVKLVATGSSARGTRVTYEFSLYGFTDAYNAISSACNIS